MLQGVSPGSGPRQVLGPPVRPPLAPQSVGRASLDLHLRPRHLRGYHPRVRLLRIAVLTPTVPKSKDFSGSAATATRRQTSWSRHTI